MNLMHALGRVATRKLQRVALSNTFKVGNASKVPGCLSKF